MLFTVRYDIKRSTDFRMKSVLLKPFLYFLSYINLMAYVQDSPFSLCSLLCSLFIGLLQKSLFYKVFHTDSGVQVPSSAVIIDAINVMFIAFFMFRCVQKLSVNCLHFFTLFFWTNIQCFFKLVSLLLV